MVNLWLCREMETLITFGRTIWFLKAKLQMKGLMRKETDWNKCNIFKEPIKLGKSFASVLLGFPWDSTGTWAQAEGMLDGQEEQLWSADHKNATTPSLLHKNAAADYLPSNPLLPYRCGNHHSTCSVEQGLTAIQPSWGGDNEQCTILTQCKCRCKHNLSRSPAFSKSLPLPTSPLVPSLYKPPSRASP